MVVREMAKHKAEPAPICMRSKAQRWWEERWWSILSVTLQDTVAATLINYGADCVGLANVDEPDLDELFAADDGSGQPASDWSRMH